MSVDHNLTGHSQGALDTPEEQTADLSLESECHQFKDIEILPMRDQYLDLTDKLLGLLRYGYFRTEAPYVMEHDDEYCLNVTSAFNIFDEHEKQNPGEV